MKLNQTKQEIKRSVFKSLKLNNLDELSSEKKYETDTDDDDDNVSLDSDQEVMFLIEQVLYLFVRFFFLKNFFSFIVSYNWHLHASN